MRARFLRPEERRYAVSIFGKTLPLDDILVTDNTGSTIFPGEPFETPNGKRKYCLSMGSDGFTSCLTPGVRPVLIHRLTHLWQRKFMPTQLTGNCCQPATYQVGHSWRTYTPEQQATMVTDWVLEGMRTSDPRASYISNHIRLGAA